MKAVRIEKFGGPEVLAYGDLPDPKPGEGEVLVRVRACALNHLDIWVREGIPAYKIRLPHVLGNDIAGEVAALGPGVSGALLGAKVVVSPGRSCWRCARCLAGEDNLCERYGILGANGGWGGYAELAAVPATNLIPMPAGLDFDAAASFPLAFLTAWHMLMTLARLGPGQRVLVVGAGSGVGVAAIQIARLAGATVIAASTSEGKLASAKALGADDGLLMDASWERKLRALAPEGLDVVFEHVGKGVFSEALKALRPGGTLVTCGATAGHDPELDLRYVFSRELRIVGARMGTLAELRRVAALFGQGRLKPVVDRAFPLAEARAAQEHLAARRQFGKVLLRP
ncbi:MAG TPA: zinc-binding dehydrogenase [Elusimicrobiota bacterium]|jgi:NADPH:quinone reductase-like Zn-dependent oxidoreductase|nr:zinc-binding dehydrogenase [Elusimicrobiota bacterium]